MTLNDCQKKDRLIVEKKRFREYEEPSQELLDILEKCSKYKTKFQIKYNGAVFI